ncbi:unnamed protein product [Durusdinium trenchii]|uniref:AAA+ ATPase domain-containing protein n=1 Tax=Durusdinium trenchii TaxID=1381693 RepID=A0ABP0QV49_9DINO
MAENSSTCAPSTAEELHRKHPLLKEILPPMLQDLFDDQELCDPKLPFPSDAIFVNFLAAKVLCANKLRETLQIISRTALEVAASNLEPLIERQRTLRMGLQDCGAWLLSLEARKVQAAEAEGSAVFAPRFTRVVRRLELSEKEVRAFEHILVLQCLPEKLRELKGCMELTAYAKLNPSEFVHFASKSRAHLKQGIITEVSLGYAADPDRHLEDEPLGHAFFSPESVKALTGAELSPTERLKVDEGALAEVLREEGKDELEVSQGEPVTTAQKRPNEIEVESNKKLKVDPELSQKPPPAEAVPPEEEDHPEDLFDIISSERLRDEERAREAEEKDEDVQEEVGKLTAYKTDLEYLVDAVELVSRKGRLYQVKQKLEEKKSSIDEDEQEDTYPSYPEPPWPRRSDAGRERRKARELEGQVKQLNRKMQERMRLTKLSPSAWIPRLERILSSRQMNEFEKEVVILLVGLILLPHRFLQRGAGMYHCRGEPIDVATVLALLSPDLASQIANRKSFYKDSVLVRDHIIHVSTKGVHGDLSSCPVEIDRRMVDFIVGLDSEVHQLVDGSHLYLPQTKMESVVLPEETKTLITKTVQSLSLFKKSKQQFKLDETISSSGLVMLFYGDSGTGKTMTANAIANLLGKKLLLINFPSLGGEQAAGFIRMIFRESKINDAVLFFDECESIFESRDKSNQRDVNMLLTELERHDGMIILATNRPFDLDEAMHRRITLAIEFQKPDHVLRKHIWSSLIPAALPLSGDVDLSALAMRYELSGGFIKNAILTALSIACSRAQETNQSGKPDICITQDDLARGAQLQLRGRLAMRSFERRIVPRSGLEVLVCGQSLRKKLQEVIDFEKSKTVLYGQWGFGGRTAFSGGQPEIGSCVLFYGPPGTGKSLAAQAIGFEVGRALKVVNSANIVDKYVGETGKNIEKVFAEAETEDMEGVIGCHRQVRRGLWRPFWSSMRPKASLAGGTRRRPAASTSIPTWIQGSCSTGWSIIQAYAFLRPMLEMLLILPSSDASASWWSSRRRTGRRAPSCGTRRCRSWRRGAPTWTCSPWPRNLRSSRVETSRMRSFAPHQGQRCGPRRGGSDVSAWQIFAKLLALRGARQMSPCKDSTCELRAKVDVNSAGRCNRLHS